MVKSNVAIVGPPVRFRACADFIFCSLLKPWMIHQLIQGKVQLPFPSMKKAIGSSVKPRGNANSSGVSYCFPLVIRLARQLVKMKPSHEHLYTISSPDRQWNIPRCLFPTKEKRPLPHSGKALQGVAASPSSTVGGRIQRSTEEEALRDAASTFYVSRITFWINKERLPQLPLLYFYFLETLEEISKGWIIFAKKVSGEVNNYHVHATKIRKEHRRIYYMYKRSMKFV